MNLRHALTITIGLLASSVAFAQEGSEDLDDIIGPTGDSKDMTVREEADALAREAEAEKRDKTQEIKLQDSKRRVIKTLQPKYVLKLGRAEVMPWFGGVTNDPFVRPILVGLNLGYHVTEILGIEYHGSLTLPLEGANEEGDLKKITDDIKQNNEVLPEISRLRTHHTINFNFSPFYGKVAVVGRNSIIFDLYGSLGAGIAYTEDSLILTQKADDPKAAASARQVHPAINFGGGVRVMFGNTAGIRFEVRNLSYIGVLESTKLELKNNLILMGGASIFFGRRVQ